MATEIVEADVAVEEACDSDGHGDLATDLIGLQDAIQEQKANLTGLPEGLRQEASELKAQLSCMTLVDRLEGLKDSLVCTSVDDGGVSGEECLSATLNAVNALYAAEKTELETDLADMMSSLKDAKEIAAKLETDKMRLQKEMLELQLLMNADSQAEPSEKNSLPCIPETGQESDTDSPRISAVAEEEGLGEKPL